MLTGPVLPSHRWSAQYSAQDRPPSRLGRIRDFRTWLWALHQVPSVWWRDRQSDCDFGRPWTRCWIVIGGAPSLSTSGKL